MAAGAVGPGLCKAAPQAVVDGDIRAAFDRSTVVPVTVEREQQVGHRRTAVVLSAAGLFAGLAVPVSAAGSAGAAPAPMAKLSGTQSAASRTPRCQSVPSGSVVAFQVVLGPRAPAAARRFAMAVSTPGSAAYRHYLTPSRWEAAYSPTVAQVASVTSWLHQAGLDVGTVGRPHDRCRIRHGSRVERAFATTLSLHDVGGHTLREADGALSVPADLVGVVVGASGISQTMATPDLVTDGPVAAAGADAAQPPGTGHPSPAARTTANRRTRPTGLRQRLPVAGPVCRVRLRAAELRSVYDLPDQVAGGADGTGETVAVIDSYASPTLASDAAQYAAIEDPGHPYAAGAVHRVAAGPLRRAPAVSGDRLVRRADARRRVGPRHRPGCEDPLRRSRRLLRLPVHQPSDRHRRRPGQRDHRFVG